MRILLVEPFYGGSHRAWADGYAAHSSHEVHLVTHPDTAWRWRLRGGALTLADDIARTVADAGPPDVVLVSDMVNLPTLLGYARRSVGAVPVAAYFHENQLLYPVADGGAGPDRQLALVNWLTLAAADLALFNSAHHRDGLMAALPRFLGEVADDRHLQHLESVLARSEVMPVGVDLDDLSPDRRPEGDGEPPLVLWNHRWEWDKQLGRALRLLQGLAGEGIEFAVAFAGEQPDHLSAGLRRGVDDLGDRVVHQGFLPRDEYIDLLLRSDVVLSTAQHEFFGIAMVEAMAAGCVPVLPESLSYPEIVPPEWHDVALHDRRGDGPEGHLRSVLTGLPVARRAVDGLAAAMRRYDWSVVAPACDDRLERLAATGA
jgi:glycosyltransferase involved in cell wall biosynthesis